MEVWSPPGVSVLDVCCCDHPILTVSFGKLCLDAVVNVRARCEEVLLSKTRGLIRSTITHFAWRCGLKVCDCSEAGP
jgi:hypothetical protein